MITYSLENNSVFSVKFIGPTAFIDVKEFLEKFKKINNLPQDIKLLYDFREGKIDFMEEDLITIAKLADEATVGYRSVRTAFIASEPDSTAFTFIFSQLKKHAHIQRHVFSTQEAAMNWLCG